MSDENIDHIYPGIGRLNYFVAHLGMGAAVVISVIYFGPGSPVVKIIGLAAMIGGFVLDVMRLRNIGVSQWFALLRLVPYVSILFGIGLQSAQTGWIENRRLDRSGITIAALHFALIALAIFLIFWAKISMDYLA